MPNSVKTLLSVACLATAAGGYSFMVYLEQWGPSYAVAFLGVFATVSLWVFPEVFTKDVKARGPGTGAYVSGRER